MDELAVGRRHRIGIGGILHETNTFAASPTVFDDFQQNSDRPGVVRGRAIPAILGEMNIGIAGAHEELASTGHDAVPLVWAAAAPGGTVDYGTFERLAQMLVDETQRAMPLDGLYLDLHGAMVAEGFPDGEGEILSRLRREIGTEIPIVCSLDFHANVTPAMMEHATGMVAYRTYPHVDQRATGRRAIRLLLRALSRRRAPARCFMQLPYLIPTPWQSTLTEPTLSVMRLLDRLETPVVESLSFTPGFPAADTYHCAPAVFGYGWSEQEVNAAVKHMHRLLVEAERDFAGILYQPTDAVREAIDRSSLSKRPVILADTQDNPGGGGTSDTIGVLAALVAADAQDAVLALICDPSSAAAAHRAGVGANITLDLGAKSGAYGELPFRSSFVVERLTDGTFPCTGPMLKGSRMELGPTALLRVGGVRVIVATRRMQPMDRALFRHVGIEPSEQRILVLKSSVHFRADFQDLADSILLVESPGALLVDLTKYPFRELRPGIRLGPLGPPFTKKDGHA